MNIISRKIVKIRLLLITGRLLWLFLTYVSIFSYCNLLAAETVNTYRIKRIVIDAGHGGKDPGAIGALGYEKDVVLPIALEVGRLIKQKFSDIEIIYTRKTDIFIPLHRRAEIANSSKADLFISIHANAHLLKSYYGAETYVMGLHSSRRNLEVAKRENSVIVLEDDYSRKYESYDSGSYESAIIFSLMQDIYNEQSLLFAAEIQKQFKERAKRLDGGVRQAGFIVLWETAMPSVLIETGYMSNSEEEKFLQTTEGQEKLAFSIFKAFENYKNLVEKNTEIAKSEKTEADKVTVSKKKLPANTTRNKPVENKAKVSSIRFEVQIGASKKPISIHSSAFKGITNIREFKIDGVYKYSVGNESKYSGITVLKEKIQQKIPDAFIIAFRDNQKISIQEALKYTSL